MSKRPRKGFALIAALIAVVVSAALIVGIFLSATEESRTSGAINLGARALGAAESAVQSNGIAWAGVQADSVKVGERRARLVEAAGVVVTTTLIRLDSSDFLLVGEGAAGTQLAGGGAAIRRRIGLLLTFFTDSSGKRTLLPVGERAWSELF